MSTTKIIILVVSSILLVCLIAAGIIIGTNYANGKATDLFGLVSGKGINVNESADLDMTGIEVVNVDCVSGKIIIAPGEPRAELTGTIITATPKDKYLSVSESNGRLTVKYDAEMLFPATISGNVTLKVYLPEEAMVDLDISGASADTNVSGLKLQDMSVVSASGAARISDCEGRNLRINVTSGIIDTQSANFASIDAGCTSGDVSIKNTTGSVIVGSTSGSVRVTNAAGDVQITNTSGNAIVTQEQKQLGNIRVGITSGNIELRLNPQAAFHLDAESTSGGLQTDFDLTVSGDMANSIIGENVSGKVNGGGANVDLNTTSGNIRVMKISE